MIDDEFGRLDTPDCNGSPSGLSATDMPEEKGEMSARLVSKATLQISSFNGVYEEAYNCLEYSVHIRGRIHRFIDRDKDVKATEMGLKKPLAKTEAITLFNAFTRSLPVDFTRLGKSRDPRG